MQCSVMQLPQADDLIKVFFFSLLPKSSGVSLLAAARYDSSSLPPPVTSEDHPHPTPQPTQCSSSSVLHCWVKASLNTEPACQSCIR